MYTGTLISDLISTVERAEQRTRQAAEAAELELWYAASHELAPVEPNLVGVA
ncbi:MAG TPA: hypothetical protein VMT28_13130 [Terriglobales bacterium]|jgi:hypothetical protein|nr:hypothetical protein [Terriglobales bacterium]